MQTSLNALLCINDPEIEKVAQGQLSGFTRHSASSPEEALNKLSLHSCSLVLVYERFCGPMLKDFLGEFSKLPTSQRRGMHLVLIGSDFITADPAQAFQQSADLVVNSSDIPRLGETISASLAQKRTFYQPFMECLNQIDSNQA